MVDATMVGWGLITAGIILLLIETAMPGFFIGIPGTVLLVMGVLAFVAPDIAFDPLWAPVITIVVGVPATVGTIMLYRKLAPATAPPTTMSADSLVGKQGRVTRALSTESRRGKVRIERAQWSAMSLKGDIPEGARVRVVRVDGVTLVVDAEPDGADAAARENPSSASRASGTSSDAAKDAESKSRSEGA